MKLGFFGASALAAVALTVMLSGAASGKAPPAPLKGCPATLNDFLAADGVVGAGYTDAGGVRTYTFTAFLDNDNGTGIPGLIGYCVYSTKTPSSVDATLDTWKSDQNGQNFDFVRGGGNKTNIPYDADTHDVGTATFGADNLPPDGADKILLHISDAATCRALYGGDVTTCYVLPGEAPGPVCDAAASGDTNAAYNDIPKDAVDCGPPSEAFEAQSASEFGDEVTLNGSGSLVSLTVLFNSYACEDHPLWNNSQCTTSDPTKTFTHSITANIYAASVNGVPGALLATATQTQTIPYRPSADTTKCGTTGAFFNPISGSCEFSKKVLLTFTDWTLNGQSVNPTLSGNVVWTVAYNTTHYGYNPIGEGAACYTSTAGCPYDSLNVGTKTFANAPYAGAFADDSDAFLNSSWTGAYCDNGSGGTGTLRQDASCWTGFQPLGKIVLGQ